MEKLKKYFPYIYILFLIFSFLYVRSVLKEGDLREYDDEVEKAIKVVDVDVTLIVNGEEYIPVDKQRSDDTVLDLMEELRGDDLFYYEKTDYTYGTEIDMVNGILPQNGYLWKVFDSQNDITNTIGDVILIDDSVYEIRLEKE